jgi:hypothetical protein
MTELANAIQSAIEIATRLRNMSKKIEDAEIKTLFADLMGQLADAKLECVNLKTEIASLKEKNQEQAAALKKRDEGKPKLANGVYKFEDDDGEFCTRCWDAQKQRIRVTELSGAFRDIGRATCPQCKAVFN